MRPLLLLCAALAACADGAPNEPAATCDAQDRAPLPEARQATRDAAPPVPFESLAAFGSDLPLVVLDTAGAPVVDEPKVAAELLMYAAGGDLAGGPQRTERAGVELRGNFFSLLFPKKQLGLEVRDARGGDRAVALLGMPPGADWVVSATAVDLAMLRNPIAYTIGAWMGLRTPQIRFVEVFLNQSGGALAAGDYLGLYALTEKLTRSPGALDVDPAAGFIAEVTTPGVIWPDEPWICLPVSGKPAAIVLPRQPEPARQGAIAARLGALEDALYRGSFAALERLLDVDAAVDYWLLHEVLRNDDAFDRSLFVHQVRSGKLVLGPAWDFDLAMGAAQGQVADGWSVREETWGDALWRHAAFRERLIARWQALRADALTDARVTAALDTMWDEIRAAAYRSDARWPSLRALTRFPEHDPDARRARLEAWLHERFAWVDEHIGSTLTPGS